MVGLLLLPLIPWIRHGNRPWILIGLFAILLIQGTVVQTNWKFRAPPRLDRDGLPDRRRPGADHGRLSPAAEPGALVSVGLIALVAAVALGRVRENYYLDHRYVTSVRPPLGGGFRASPQWQPLQDWGTAARDERIGVVGRASAFGQYFFYGTDLSNYVQYVGRQLNRGTFRPIDTCALWRREIDEGDYRFIVITPKLGQSETVAPPEDLWTSTDRSVKTVIQLRPGGRLQDHRAARPRPACSKLGAKAHT